MLETKITRYEREKRVKSLKDEIKWQMEKIDALKLNMLKQEYELYRLYSELNHTVVR